MWALALLCKALAFSPGFGEGWADSLSVGATSNVAPTDAKRRHAERARERERRRAEKRMRVAVSPEGQMDLMDRVDGYAKRHERRHSERYRPHDASETLEEYNFRRAVQSGAKDRRHTENPFWKAASFVESMASSREKETHAQAMRERDLRISPEEQYGCPKDHWHSCSFSQDEYDDPGCECKTGEIRYGSRNTDSWTHSIHLGDAAGATCNIEDLRRIAIKNPDDSSSNEDPICQCVERFMYIWVDEGHLSGDFTSFVELDDEENLGSEERERTTGVKKCLVPKELSSLKDAAEDIHSDVVFEECDTSNLAMEWIFYLSSGQIKNMKTNKCITVDYHEEATYRRVKLDTCDMIDSQLKTQRFDVPSYLTSKEEPFEYSSGSIKMAYGAHNSDAVCLSTDLINLFIETCASIQGSVEFNLESNVGKHEWEGCATQDSECSCKGEIRYGYEDAGTWTSGVPIYEEYATCDLYQMRKTFIAEPDATAGTKSEPECECRHDKFLDGEGDAEEAAELDAEETPADEMDDTGSDLPLDEDKKKEAEDKKNAFGNKEKAAAVGAVVLVVGGVFAYKQMGGGGGNAYSQEYEEEYEEEEEEYAEE